MTRTTTTIKVVSRIKIEDGLKGGGRREWSGIPLDQVLPYTSPG